MPFVPSVPTAFPLHAAALQSPIHTQSDQLPFAGGRRMKVPWCTNTSLSFWMLQFGREVAMAAFCPPLALQNHRRPRGLQQRHRGQQKWGQPPARAAAAETLGAASTKPSCGHAAAPGARGTGLQLPQRLSTGPGVRVLGGLAGKQLGCLGEPGLGTAHRWAAWETKPCLSTVNETGPREMRAGARGEGEFVSVIPTPSPLLASALQA